MRLNKSVFNGKNCLNAKSRKGQGLHYLKQSNEAIIAQRQSIEQVREHVYNKSGRVPTVEAAYTNSAARETMTFDGEATRTTDVMDDDKDFAN